MTHHRRRQPRGRANGLSPAIRWHRRVGVTLAIILVLVALTGVALNHGEKFRLREVRIDSEWVYRWYGMQPQGEPAAVRWQERWVVWLDGSVYLDGRPVARLADVQGAVGLGPLLIAAGPRELLLVASTGEVVERLGEAALPPGGISRVGRTSGAEPRLIVRTEPGLLYRFDADLVRWVEVDEPETVEWSAPEPPPAELREQVIRAYRGEGLTLHRIIVDLHSGRFFGSAGVWVVDLAAIGLLFLTFTGLYSVLRGRRKAE